MKHGIISLFISSCFLFSSCSLYHSIFKSKQSSSESETNLVLSSDSTVVISSISNQVESTEEEANSYTREYDTTQAPDSSGNYPLKRETWTNFSKKSDKSEQLQQQSETNVSKEEKSNQITTENSSETTKTETDSQAAGGNWIAFLWVGLVFIGAILFYFFIAKKWLKQDF